MLKSAGLSEELCGTMHIKLMAVDEYGARMTVWVLLKGRS